MQELKIFFSFKAYHLNLACVDALYFREKRNEKNNKKVKLVKSLL